MNRLLYVVAGNIVGAILGLIVGAILLIAAVQVGVAVGWGVLTYAVFFVLGIILAFVNPLKLDS